MLKNRAAVMGSIDAGNAHVDQTISDKKGVTAGAWRLSLYLWYLYLRKHFGATPSLDKKKADLIGLKKSDIFR